MIGHEVHILVFDGFSPRLAEQAAKNNLGVRKQNLDAELSAEVLRLSDELRKRLSRLVEDLEDGLLD